jgi:hypothetical protein
MAVACKVNRDHTMILGEMGQLGAPVAGIATPAMNEHKSRFSSAVDLI